MLDQLRKHRPARDGDGASPLHRTELAPLRMLAAEMLVVTGIGATLDVLARSYQAQRDRIPGRSGSTSLPMAAVWGPALLAPVAAVAHVRQATSPEPNAARANRVLDAAVVGLGLVELVNSMTGRRRASRYPSLVPLAFASAGLLGLVVSGREREIDREHRRLKARAEVISRLVPRRRPRLDRVVVHV